MSLRDFGHAYVEVHVRFWEAIGFTDKMRVPRWYARIWRYPDSTWSDDRRKWKSNGYHVGHITAYVVPAAIIAILVL